VTETLILPEQMDAPRPDVVANGRVMNVGQARAVYVSPEEICSSVEYFERRQAMKQPEITVKDLIDALIDLTGHPPWRYNGPGISTDDLAEFTGLSKERCQKLVELGRFAHDVRTGKAIVANG
jgi:hypothetical protein